MRRFGGSVRTRTAIGATVVVAVALVAAGLLVLSSVRSGLGDTATSRAEAKAREVATQVAAHADPRRAAGLDTEDPVQVVNAEGKVLARSDGAEELRAPMSARNRPEPPSPSPTDDDARPDDNDRGGDAGQDDRNDDADDSGDDSDDSADDGADDGGDDADDNAGAKTGADRERGDDAGDDPPGTSDGSGGATATPPAPRGQVSSAVGHDTITLSVGDDGLPVGEPTGAGGSATSRFSIASVRASTPDGTPVTVYAGASLAAQQRAVNDAGRAMLAGLPFVLALVGLVAWLVVTRALRPVEAIRSELATITAGDDLGRRVPVPAARDEIGALARTTNETLAALESSLERQRRFVADASHELRSPIASLRTQLEVAAAHPELLDVDGLVVDIVRLQELATDLLLLARLDAGETPPRESVALADLVREDLARRRDPLDVHPHVAEDATVYGSRSQIGRVVTNLVDNAVRHARSRVTVTVSSLASRASITVDDDGPGVPPEQAERIFERFVRLDESRARDEGGAGLGLTIARDVARRHGGDLILERSPAGGARFEARFERGKGPPDGAQ